MLPKISKELNKTLGKEKEVQYYRIILGNWLIHFIHQAYDKYRIIQEISKMGSINTFILDPEEHYFPFDFLDYNHKTETDIYQLQLFSEIVKYMGISYEIKKTKPLNSKIQIKNKSWIQNYKKKILQLKDLFYKIFSTNEVVIVGPYFKKNKYLYELLLWFKSKGKISFDPFNYSPKYSIKKRDINFRNSFKIKSNNFEDWILSFVMQNIPNAYLENHHEHINAVSNVYPTDKTKTFLTYNDLYHNTNFQFYIAQNYKKKKIYSAQHGCAYGMDLRHEGEEFEKSISDIFFTYGWIESSKTKPLPTPKIIGSRGSSHKKKILFLTTTRTRYVQRFFQAPFSSKMLVDHVKNPITFLSNLNKIDEIFIRHHHIHDARGWNNRQRIIDRFPNIKEDPNISFYDSLNTCRLFISDHFGTTFLEALQSNTPSIIFINKSSYLFRKDFKPFVKKMIHFKILFYDPIEASIFVNSNERNIIKWWFSDDLQKFRKEFINKHALTSKKWKSVWCDSLLNS